jgi:hypothetical protein
MRIASLTEDKPAEGVARIIPEAGEVTMWMSPVCAGDVMGVHTLEEYTEGDGPTPEWYRPDEPMAAEWEDSSTQQSEGQSDSVDYIERHDIGCPDWNLCSTLYGAHGLTAEPWELDLMARIVSREVCGCSRTCWEAVADSILRRVETGHWGSTIYSVLSAVEENGSWAYDTWPYIWDGEIELYDEIRAVCEERFYNGAEWDATHFRTEYYHPWAISLYEIDGVYFSLSPYLIGGVAG